MKHSSNYSSLLVLIYIIKYNYYRIRPGVGVGVVWERVDMKLVKLIRVQWEGSIEMKVLKIIF
jgi:hypothetical protein